MPVKFSKLNHQVSHGDQVLVDAIECYRLKLAEFNHATHIKLAYCYLVSLGPADGQVKMQDTLVKFLNFNGVDRKKFHVTLTQAWLIAVWHFMQKSPTMASADDFVKANPGLLNKDLLASHYSHDLLFSERARNKFVNPDLSPFPEG